MYLNVVAGQKGGSMTKHRTNKTSNRQNVETAKYMYDRRSKILKFEKTSKKTEKISKTLNISSL